MVTTAGELTLAQPHRQALGPSAADRDALLAFLRQLEGSETSGPPEIFSDGFESGDTSAWSSSP